MLIKCPECDLQVSDKAISCPHCGYPLKQNQKQRISTKRKRLPNGFGQITFLKGRNLRNPYRAMITVGKTEKGRPICKLLKPIAYFPTYNDAYAALLEYNKNPYDVSSNTTVEDLYELWKSDYFKELVPESQKTIKNTWRYCASLYKYNVRSLRAGHIRNCMETATAKNKDGSIKKASNMIQLRIKSLFNKMLDYAVEYEMVDKNVAKNFTSPISTTKAVKRETKNHISFTDEEMATLWQNITEPFVDLIIIQCYMGWRPGELIDLKTENMKDGFIVGGKKTDAGKNRMVPIHSRIIPLIQKYNNSENEYLFSVKDRRVKYGELYHKLSYKEYNEAFKSVISNLGLNPEHKPHDCRKQFITMAKEYNVDEYAIKLIAGHYVHDLTERIYTDRKPEWLKQEIEKIK